jgi:hypothetical protein
VTDPDEEPRVISIRLQMPWWLSRFALKHFLRGAKQRAEVTGKSSSSRKLLGGKLEILTVVEGVHDAAPPKA